MAHGGARAGAGRKPGIRKAVAVSWRITSDSRDWIKEAAEQAGISQGEIVDELVSVCKDMFEKPRPTCRHCQHYDNDCPMKIDYNSRGLLFCYPSRICSDYDAAI